MTGPPMYSQHTVNCTFITEEDSYTRFLDENDNVVLMIPTANILSIEYVSNP